MKPCVEVLGRIRIRELRFADSYDSSEFSSRSSRTWRFNRCRLERIWDLFGIAVAELTWQ